ncbi:MAG: hypothetical protein K1X89_00450 [Myxococcaceae bacterium]|nr:hypothetical protein [Myxococcaceae bacterium]
MRASIAGAALFLSVVACGGKPGGQSSPAADAGSDGGSDAGLDAGVPPEPTSDAGRPDAGPVCSRGRSCTITWTESDPLPVKVDHHTIHIHTSKAGTFLYVFGGIRAELATPKAFYRHVFRAPIRDDGTLGAWEALAELPTTLGFHAIAANDTTVYLVGGLTVVQGAIDAHDETVVGTFADDGTITWRLGGKLGHPVQHATALVDGNTLRFFGGSYTNALDTTDVSTIGPDGLNGDFTPGPKLSSPRTHHSQFVFQGRVFLVGGFNALAEAEPSIVASVSDGGWEKVGIMGTPNFASAAVLQGDGLLLIGGATGTFYDETFTDVVQRAGVWPDSTLGVFSEAGRLPVARAHVHDVPVFRDTLYSVGGRVTPSLDSSDRVFIGRMTSAE